jgi:lactate racemase-like protein
MKLPDQMLVEARLPSHALAHPGAEATARLEATLGGLDLARRRIAVAAGSRGIDRIAEVTFAVVSWLKSRGAQPFLLPAMGSHGGGTAEGQTELLASYDITEASMGVPVRASMEVVEIGRTEAGVPVFCAREALEAEGLIVVNRVKPHTDFESTRLGSGLLKMCAIGLGKVEGAGAAHRAAALHGYEASILAASRLVRSRAPLIAGVALVEDPHHRLALVEVIPAAAIEAREPELLAQARSWMPALPFAEIDVLIVDEIGKNVSGAGMDTNVIGRGVHGEPFRTARARARVIYARGLTPESHGNAVGLGLADVISSRLMAAMDPRVTYTNAITALTPATVRVPMHFDTDAECLRAAVRVSAADPDRVRIVRVRNTLALDRFVASAAYADEVAQRSDLEVISPAEPWTLTAEGNFDTDRDLLGGPLAA